MPRAQQSKRMTANEYLSFEEKAKTKHEFVDGFVFAMAGASDAHNLISTSMISRVGSAARGTSCRAYVSDMKVQTGDVYYYPDILLTCDDNDLNKNIKTHPCFIIEILSESTSDIDKGEKLINYRKLTSLKAYILVSQTQKLVEVYRRMNDDSWRHDILEEGSFDLPCLDVSLSLDEVYEDIPV